MGKEARLGANTMGLRAGSITEAGHRKWGLWWACALREYRKLAWVLKTSAPLPAFFLSQPCLALVLLELMFTPFLLASCVPQTTCMQPPAKALHMVLR